jgi:ribonuclease HIII
MKEILIEIEDNQVENLLKDLKKYKINSVDEVITFDEAKKRVAEAVEEYKSGKMKLIDDDDFWNEINKFVDKL